MINRNHSRNSQIKLLVMIREEKNLELLLQVKMEAMRLKRRKERRNER